MKRLTKDIKRALSALASAEAGEMLPRRHKLRHLNDGAPQPANSSDTSAHPGLRRQIALWHDGASSTSTLDYVTGTCNRLDMDLVFLCPDASPDPTGSEIKSLDAGTQGISHAVARLSGEPRQSLIRYLDTHHQVAFVVFSGSDNLLLSLTDNFAHKAHGMRIPVPFVVVGENANNAADNAPA